jgi:hypothetical protein
MWLSIGTPAAPGNNYADALHHSELAAKNCSDRAG